jgi:carboxypeptidase C (cathepsin A)
MQGNSLSAEGRQAIAEKLRAYTGLPVAYLLKANLRIEYGAFQKELLGDQGLTTGTLDTRFAGPTLDPLSKIAEYDPQSADISSAYVAAFNAYVREKRPAGSLFGMARRRSPARVRQGRPHDGKAGGAVPVHP